MIKQEVAEGKSGREDAPPLSPPFSDPRRRRHGPTGHLNIGSTAAPRPARLSLPSSTNTSYRCRRMLVDFDTQGARSPDSAPPAPPSTPGTGAPPEDSGPNVYPTPSRSVNGQKESAAPERIRSGLIGIRPLVAERPERGGTSRGRGCRLLSSTADRGWLGPSRNTTPGSPVRTGVKDTSRWLI